MYKSMGAKHSNWQLSQNNQYGVGTNLEVVRPGQGSGGLTPSGDPRGRAPGEGQGAKPPGSQRFLKI